MNAMAPELIEESVLKFRNFLENATIGDTFLATIALGARKAGEEPRGMILLETRTPLGYSKTELNILWSSPLGEDPAAKTI